MKGATYKLAVPLFFASGTLFGRIDQANITLLLICSCMAFVIARQTGFLRGIFFFSIGLLLSISNLHGIEKVKAAKSFYQKGADITVVIKRTESEKIRSVRYIARLTQVGDRKTDMNIYLYLRRSRDAKFYLPGDILKIKNVTIRPPENFRNESAFDYEKYLSRRSISLLVFTGSKSRVRIVGKKFSIFRPVDRLKNRIRKNLEFKNRYAGAVAKAMLIGDKGLVSGTLREKFARAGLAHLLAVSGLHIGFVATTIYFIFRLIFFLIVYNLSYRSASSGLPTKLSAIVAIFGVVVYTMMTGANFPAMRAGIMVGVYLLATFFGRGRDFYGAFSVAVLLVLAFYPWALFDVGAQLSFVAVFAIVVFLELLINKKEAEQKTMSDLSSSWWRGLASRHKVIAGVICVPFFAYIGIAPIAVASFHLVSFVSVAVNIVTVPFVSIVIPVSLVLAVVGYAPTMPLVEHSFWLINQIAYMAGSADFSSRYVADINPSVVVLLYTAILLFIFMKKGWMKVTALASIIVLASLFVLLPKFSKKTEAGMSVRFLDVGQGSAAIIKWPGGAMVIDGGPRHGTFDIGRYVVAPSLWHLGVDRLDAIISTHEDMDHSGGIPALAGIFRAQNYYDNGAELSGWRMKKLRRRYERAGRYKGLEAGDTFHFPDGPTIDVVHPPVGLVKKANDNEGSLGMIVRYQGVRLLFMSDIGFEGEQMLIDSGENISADLILIGHHGSAGSTSSELLEKTGAKIGVISVGRHNSFGHPTESVIKRLQSKNIKIYRTDIDGETVVSVVDGTMRIRSFAQNKFKGF